MRLIGLDHGAKRIGVAVGDTETGMAFARPAIKRRNLDHDLALVGELCTTEGATVVVIGLPLLLDGTEGTRGGGLQVAYEDERLTSWEAERQSSAQGRHPRRDSGEIDSAAARLILQQYLDARPPTPFRPEETE